MSEMLCCLFQSCFFKYVEYTDADAQPQLKWPVFIYSQLNPFMCLVKQLYD